MSVLELPGGHLLRKQDIQLCKVSALGFGKSEEGPDKAEETKTCVEEASLGLSVPCRWVQHVRDDDIHENVDDVVQISTEHNCSRPQAAIADGADRHVVNASV